MTTPIEAGAREMWEADSPAPDLGWPHWDVAVDRAANQLWDLPQMVADTRMLTRAAVTGAVEAADLQRAVHAAVCGDPWADCEDAEENALCAAAASAVRSELLR